MNGVLEHFLFNPPMSPLAQQTGLKTGGVDTSDPTKLANFEWGVVCTKLSVLPKTQLPIMAKCSAAFAKLLEASKGKCKTPDSTLQAAMCQMVTTLVRLYAFA